MKTHDRELRSGDLSTSLRGKIAIVTGGGSGIGAAAASRLASDGARVMIADINGDAASHVARTIGVDGAEVRAMVCDVGDPEQNERLVAETLAAFGSVDILVHCAAVCHAYDPLEVSVETWRQVMAINLDGAFFLARAVARAMKKGGSGAIVLFTSGRAEKGSSNYLPYAVSKGGIITLVKSLAAALGEHGITVNGLNPGYTDTPLARNAAADANTWDKWTQTDALLSFSRPEQIAETIAFLVGPAASYMTGQIVSTRIQRSG